LKEEGQTQEQIAAQLGVSQQVISKLVSGNTTHGNTGLDARKTLST